MVKVRSYELNAGFYVKARNMIGVNVYVYDLG